MMKLFSYYRSSCSFRVRIALNLKEIECEYHFININPAISQQKGENYRAVNPQGRVPFLIDDGVRLSQSLAIIEYLEEKYPTPPLLPSSTNERAKARQLVSLIHADIQPLNNLAMLKALQSRFNADREEVDSWYRHWINEGFSAFEALLRDKESEKGYCLGESSGMADIFLIPQVWNAMRFDVDLGPYPKITNIYENCMQLPAFISAAPESQSDAV